MENDSAAGMQPLLYKHHSDGEYLVESARMVGDLDDYAIWRGGRAAWRDAVATVLSDSFSVEHGMRFRKACHTPPDEAGWKRQYEAELRTLEDGLELLDSLRASLAEDARVGPGDEHDYGH